MRNKTIARDLDVLRVNALSNKHVDPMMIQDLYEKVRDYITKLEKGSAKK